MWSDQGSFTYLFPTFVNQGQPFLPKVNITSEFISGLSCRTPASGAVSWFDAEIPGLLLEHRSSGGATFYFRYRDAAKAIRLCRIGRLGDLPLERVRAQAWSMREMQQAGGDPKREFHRFMDAPVLNDFVSQRYVPYVNARKRSWQMDVGMFNLHIAPVLGPLRMSRITSADVRSFVQQLFEKGYAHATCNRMLVLLKHVFNCAIRFEVLPLMPTPARGLRCLI